MVRSLRSLIYNVMEWWEKNERTMGMKIRKEFGYFHLIHHLQLTSFHVFLLYPFSVWNEWNEVKKDERRKRGGRRSERRNEKNTIHFIHLSFALLFGSLIM